MDLYKSAQSKLNKIIGLTDNNNYNKMKMVTLTTTKLEKNPNTKTTYKEVSKEVKNISFEQYDKITNEDTIKFFRRLGGSETATKAYTSQGYKIVRLVSTSPDKEYKTIREFKFK